jgi:hypothetical protein
MQSLEEFRESAEEVSPPPPSFPRNGNVVKFNYNYTCPGCKEYFKMVTGPLCTACDITYRQQWEGL